MQLCCTNTTVQRRCCGTGLPDRLQPQHKPHHLCGGKEKGKQEWSTLKEQILPHHFLNHTQCERLCFADCIKQLECIPRSPDTSHCPAPASPCKLARQGYS